VKTVRAIYGFVTGGSLVAPIGTCVAILLTIFCATHGFGPKAAGIALLATLALTLAGSALESAR
jgi:hypothetical protein